MTTSVQDVLMPKDTFFQTMSDEVIPMVMPFLLIIASIYGVRIIIASVIK